MKPLDTLLAVAVAAIWGMGFIFAKAAIGEFPPILLMAFRFTVTAIALVWFVRPPLHVFRHIFWAALIGCAVQYSLTFTGLRSIDASVAIIVVQLEVPFAALLAAIVFGDKLGWRRAMGMLLAFLGVSLIAGEPRHEGELLPILLVVGGAFSWAIGQVLIKRMGSVGGFTLIAWVAVFSAPQLFACSALFETGQLDAIATAGWVVWGAVIYLGLVMTALGYGIWYRLIASYDINQVMPFLLLLPVFTVIGSVAILGESLTLTVVLGGLIAVAGVGIITVERNPFRSSVP